MLRPKSSIQPAGPATLDERSAAHVIDFRPTPEELRRVIAEAARALVERGHHVIERPIEHQRVSKHDHDRLVHVWLSELDAAIAGCAS